MPGENVYDWSTIAANNATADSSINWTEGQARSSVNDSSRSEMAGVAKFRDLLCGMKITGGSANAQTFSSGITYTTVPTGLRVLLKIGPGLTNTGATTLSMDAIAAQTIKNLDGTDLTAGALTAGSYIELRYDGTNWVLLADTRPKVNRAGDTMTGALTVPSLTVSGAESVGGNLSVTGSVTAGSAGVLTGRTQLIDTGTSISLYFVTGASAYAITLDSLYHFILGGVQIGIWESSGNLTLGGACGATAFNLVSDAGIKDVVGEYHDGLAQIRMLAPIRYTIKNKPNSEHIGFVAQELEKSFPAAVNSIGIPGAGVEVETMRAVDMAALICTLVNSVKELAARLEQLETK